MALTFAEVRGLEIGKWIHNAGGVSMMLAFAGLICLGPWAWLRQIPVHWTPLALELPPPDLRTLALFGQMLFGALCGLEYIAILAGESRSPERTITQSVWICFTDHLRDVYPGNGFGGGIRSAGRHQLHCAHSADAADGTGK